MTNMRQTKNLLDYQLYLCLPTVKTFVVKSSPYKLQFETKVVCQQRVVPTQISLQLSLTPFEIVDLKT